MKITRRDVAKLLAAGVPASLLAVPSARATAAQGGPEIDPGPFTGTRESLREYHSPEWFRDAKFGIWAHWGPQSAAEYGDWYARQMYIEGHRQYKYHVQKYGHPSKFGFKDVIGTWKAERFDPGYLVALYKKAGARYFVSMGVHHDNFDLWNSRHHRWNAVEMGPRKDVVGLFRAAAKKEGLRFGVSEHLAVSYHWFQTSHGADRQGPLAGVPYDGNDPKYVDFYHEKHDTPKSAWDPANVPVEWKRKYFLRIKDLVDHYEPDLLYTDGPIFFEEWGLSLVAHHYNRGAKRNGGVPNVVYTSKRREDCALGTCVLDLERGVVDKVWPDAWQTDTCVGDWHYNREAKYKSPKLVIDMLVDIVSRNGNLLLNFPLPSSGMLDDQELRIVGEITKWMAVNSEGIYATRPWKIFGQGPSTQAEGGSFNEAKRKLLTADDVRFTAKGKTIYAFVMGWPDHSTDSMPSAAARVAGELKRVSPYSTVIGALTRAAAGKIVNVELLGYGGKLPWIQGDDGLKAQLPAAKPCDHAVALKVTLA